MRISIVAASIAALTAGVAHAADFTGTYSLGFAGLHYAQTDDDVNGNAGGLTGSASVRYTLSNGATVTGEVQGERYNLDHYSDTAPSYGLLAAVHYDQEFNGETLGAFFGTGLTSDEESGTRTILGFEGESTVLGKPLFASIGYADLRVDGSDSGFTGTFIQIGTFFDLTQDLTLKTTIGAGYDRVGYEDDGDWGRYKAASVEGIYAVNGGAYNVYFGADYTKYDANTEDSGEETTLKVGVIIPFGGASKHDVLRPLALPGTLLRAASYAETLD